MNVVGLAGSVTKPQGFRTTHQAGGSEYVHEFRVVEDAEERTVECVEKRVDGEAVDANPTNAAISELNDRGYEVIDS